MYTYGVSMVDNGYSMLFIYRFKKNTNSKGGTPRKNMGTPAFSSMGERFQKHMVSCGKPLVCGWILGNVEIEPWLDSWKNYDIW